MKHESSIACKHLTEKTKSETEVLGERRLPEYEALVFQCAGKIADNAWSNQKSCKAFSNAMEANWPAQYAKYLTNYVAHNSSCSENAHDAWVRYLTDAFASPEDVKLRLPNAGARGMAEDAMNIRRYFFRSVRRCVEPSVFPRKTATHG